MELIDALWQLILSLYHLGLDLLVLAGRWWLVLFWLAWALVGVNWTKAWSWLAKGAWAPAVLILVVMALIWSRVAPSSCNCLGFMTVPNFWWQLGAVGLIAAITLLCGWLQGILGWTPPEISLEPPAQTAHGNGHAH
jgi:hypothetical protein